MKKVILSTSIFLILAIGVVATTGKIAPLSWQLWSDVNQDSGVGLGGYDLVSYRLDGGPTIGNERYSSSWNGVAWYFSSAKNKTLFDLNPARFSPAYGGFCAFAVKNNFTADVDPMVWHLHKDKLYLFASDGSHKKWVAEISQGVIENSDLNWEQR